MEIAQISVIGGLALSAITIIAGVVNTWITKSNEYKREVHKTIIDAAYKEWVYRSDLVKEMVKANPKSSGDLHPFSETLLYYENLMSLMRKGKITEKSIQKYFKDEELREKLFRQYNEKYNTMYPPDKFSSKP